MSAEIDYPEHHEVVRSLDGYIGELNKKILLPLDKIWQPSDILPNPQDPDYIDKVVELRKSAENLPPGLIVAACGNGITEKPIAAYTSALNRIESMADKTGADWTNSAIWDRRWTGEEMRHGDAFTGYFQLSGRVNMRAFEVTSHRLMVNGFYPGFSKDPYESFDYTSFQEGATRISHHNTGKMAQENGDLTLYEICEGSSKDERRHEQFYKDVKKSIFDIDPNGAMISFWKMMEVGISMPARLMDDEGDENDLLNIKETALFGRYALVAQDLRIYTTADYADIYDGLIKYWDIEHRSVSDEGAEAQEGLMKLSKRHRGGGLERMVNIRLKNAPNPSFSWINGETVELKRSA